MHWSERVSYYFYVSINDGSTAKSQRFESFDDAFKNARNYSSKTRVERHTEFYDGYHNEWIIDWKTDGGRQIVWDSEIK